MNKTALVDTDREWKKAEEPIGAALIVGAGISGMQAALDLAEAGIKVHLIDEASAIGGTMAMLDKTFPTNDCAMCIMSPKLVELGRHLNIELLTNTEVIDVSGIPGDLAVKIHRRPRYVDTSKCTGCGDCVSVCPISLPDAFNGDLAARKAIYKLYPQAIPNAYAIEKRGTAPCRDACPINQRAQGYIALIAEGRYSDAYRTILEENPFPSICGRVCNHRCEEACSRGQFDAPVNIMALKRFVADWAWENRTSINSEEWIYQSDALAGKRVAVVGAGPAGLTCAQDLARQGCQVTVFEALPHPGGMLRFGVPPYRLPPEVVQREIDAIIAHGIDLELNHRVEDIEGLLDEFDAVFVAIGAHAGLKLPIPGADLPDVHLATEFLRQTSLQYPASDSWSSVVSGQRVLVLGGGNVAIDAAMTALRLGAAWVGITCLEGRDQMPAHNWEIQAAEEEGIQIFPARTFKEIVGREQCVTGVHTAQVVFRGFVDGMPDFDEIPDSEEVLPADLVIFAIGQRPESAGLTRVKCQSGGRIEVDPATLATNVPGIFAGGDAISGTAFIVDAIAAGHRAASSIFNYCTGSAGRAASTSTHKDLPQATLNLAEIHERIVSGRSSEVARCTIPERLPDERFKDFREIYAGFSEAQARAEATRCLRCGVCSECNQCVYACRAGAINHGDMEQTIDLNVGAVILTPGVEPLPGDVRPEYGYGRYPNVITSLQFERMLSASGPFQGVVQRPSDGNHPKKIAWIQCVGSRDYTNTLEGSLRPGEQEGEDQSGQVHCAPYCSSVCCMYATKEAVIAKEHDPRIVPTIFYIDIRSFGKGFEPYVERARSEHGVRYVRCMISSVKEVPGTGNLRLSYVTHEQIPQESKPLKHRKVSVVDEDLSFDALETQPVLHEEEFDLVVLSVGLRPSTSARAMANRLGLTLNEFGFLDVVPHKPAQTSRPGIYVAGAFAEPKDIPESVVEASCAAAQVSALLNTARGSLTRTPEYPPERDISDEAEQVGVFICHCGINIGGVVDVPAVVEFANSLGGVGYAEHNLYTCSQDTQQHIVEQIQEYGLNRVVVASCTPRTHEPLFQDTLRQAGLNPKLFEMANIREHDSWVHRDSPERATEKAKQLVAMAVAKARRLNPISRNTFEVDQRALVIGGGLAGMTAALSIARQGYSVFLVEREKGLGGNLRHIFVGFDGLQTRTNGLARAEAHPQTLLSQTIADVMAEPGITFLTEAELIEVSGYTGQYRSRVKAENGDEFEIQHGVIVVATGAREYQPTEYLYGQHPNVITQRELEGRMTDPAFMDQLAGGTLVMIQCVGSRDEGHPYCSRICCVQALKNAIFIKDRLPETKIVMLYRDVRSYGFREQLFRQARESGVIFLEYSETNKPHVSSNMDGSLALNVCVQPENQPIRLSPAWLVLSAGIVPEPDNARLARLLKVPLNEDGFFLEAHVKLRPVDFAVEGIFLAGLAHSPRFVEETIAQAQAAAVRAVGLLSKRQLEATPIVASVNPKLCAACGICVEVCPYGARLLEPGMKHAEVIEVLCQGCGACVAACPNKASQQKGFEFAQLIDMLEAAAV